jgi:NNP family nitrate/nitrite transporter-like MFS transporter
MLKGLLSFNGRYRILHLTWFAFFLTFVCWFSFTPFATTIGAELGLSKAQIDTINICNLALTIPARIIIGMILDRYGPKITYTGLLIFALIPCLATAMAQDFNQLVLSRLLMGVVGAGFVVGIRMVSEWFPPKEIGIAEGIYGGWGNFGAFGAKFFLPIVATGTAFLAGGAINWRLAVALIGIVAAIYGLIYNSSVSDTPAGKTYKKAKRGGGMEVTSPKSFYAMLVMNFGLFFAVGLMVWSLAKPQIAFINTTQLYVIWALLLGLYAFQSYKAWQVNRELMTGAKTYSPAERYEFRQVALLELTYITNFGSELAAVSMLPAFFQNTFGVAPLFAAWIAASYPLLNMVSRPSGGLISDKLGSRKWTMTIISVGIGIGYLLLYGLNSGWPIPLAIAATMFAAYFAQAGCGATYGMVPLIKREITGQIAGNVGAYGNFGGVVYLTVLSLTSPQIFFATMGIMALICASLCAFFLKEPKGSFAAHYEGETSETLPESQEFLPKGKNSMSS